MSAAAAWDVTPRPGATGTSPTRPGRPRLTLVQGGRGERGERREHVSTHHAAVRLTRRARLAITCAVALAVVVTLTSIAVRASASDVAGTVTVRPGQTLSEIASSELPEVPVSEGVVRIQLANRLSTTDVHAGQQLAIPSR